MNETKKAIRSDSKQAKNIIRKEIGLFYSPSAIGGRSTLQNMKNDADAGNGGYQKKRCTSDYQKAAYMVDGGSFACYYDDQAKMLSKIYGKEKVSSWSGDKIHETYKHLIAREYTSMIREDEAKKIKAKEKERRAAMKAAKETEKRSKKRLPTPAKKSVKRKK